LLVFDRKRHADRVMAKGPNKIVLQISDLTFLHRKNLKTAKLDASVSKLYYKIVAI
jgi:hypothetical protein